MSSSFDSYFTNSEFAKAYGFDRKSNGIIYLENEKDSDFWRGVLKKAGLTNYSIKFSSKDKSDGSRGVAGLKRYFPKLNNNVLVGIDGDYDYITNGKVTDHYHCYVKNEYILHTFSYSRESVLINNTSVNYSIGKIFFSERIDFSFDQFLKDLSNKIHFDLVYLLALHELGVVTSGDINTSFSKLSVETLDKGVHFVNYDASHAKKIISKNSINRKELDVFTNKYFNLGLNKDNAYRFINGHKVESLIKEVVHKEKVALIKKEEDKIRAEFSGRGDVISERVRELHNHINNNCSFFSILNSQPLDHDNIYIKIVEKARKLNSTV